MSKLSITQAAHVCNFERSYFYKIIKKYSISIKKDLTNKSYIDIAELVRSIPPEIINLDRLEQYTGQSLQTHETTTNNIEQHDNTTLITQLKSEIDFLKAQLHINQQQVSSLLETVNRQTFLLENKTTQRHNTKTQKTTGDEEPLKEKKNIREALNNLRKFQK